MWPTEQNRAAWEDRFGREPPAGRGLPEAVEARLPDLDGKHVLHLGCGTGEATADLRALGALVSGIDPSAEALAVARGNLSRAAELLGVTRPTLYDLLEKHHIDAAQFGKAPATEAPPT